MNKSFQDTQNQEYLELCKKRLNSSNNLIWTEQAVDIIQDVGWKTLNDVGCNVGHLYKALRSRNVTNVKYVGWDIDEIYLKIAREKFPDVPFFCMDITDEYLPQADISVCSATLEHLVNPFATLERILSRTGKIMILRTLMGENSQNHNRIKPGAIRSYPIHQFSFVDILTHFEYCGFKTEVIRDKATDSMPKYIDIGIVRTQYFVVGKRS